MLSISILPTLKILPDYLQRTQPALIIAGCYESEIIEALEKL
jgi:hypothetical protein